MDKPITYEEVDDFYKRCGFTQDETDEAFEQGGCYHAAGLILLLSRELELDDEDHNR